MQFVPTQVGQKGTFNDFCMTIKTKTSYLELLPKHWVAKEKA